MERRTGLFIKLIAVMFLVLSATTQSIAFQIGDSYGGGIIFWIDSTGQQGLIAATTDLGDVTGRMRWGSAAFDSTGATGTAVGMGSVNTQTIINVQGYSYAYAALLCANYEGGGFTDWFLPSKDELYLLYLHQDVVGSSVWGAYWSSSEFDHSLAWGKYFYDDIAQYSHKDRFNGVRAVRAFSSAPISLAAVTDLVVSGTAEQLELHWSASAGATAYDIYRLPEVNTVLDPIYLVGSVTVTSFSEPLAGLPLQGFYVVIAWN